MEISDLRKFKNDNVYALMRPAEGDPDIKMVISIILI